MKLFIFLLFISLSLEANYCVQVATSNKSERNYILNEANNRAYDQFNDLRVEPRGSYYVFRIGDYAHYADAEQNFNKIRHLDRDAYIRKCDFLKEQAIFVKNVSVTKKIQENNSQSQYKNEPERETKNYYNDVSRDRESDRRDNRNDRNKDSKYENNADANSLWNECKKCFVPAYNEEDTSSNQNRVESHKQRTEQKPRVNTTHRVQQRKVINNSKNIDEETFWRDEIGVDAYTTSDNQHKKENKFNVDENNLY